MFRTTDYGNAGLLRVQAYYSIPLWLNIQYMLQIYNDSQFFKYALWQNRQGNAFLNDANCMDFEILWLAFPFGKQDMKTGRETGDSGPLPKLGHKSRLVELSRASKNSVAIPLHCRSYDTLCHSSQRNSRCLAILRLNKETMGIQQIQFPFVIVYSGSGKAFLSAALLNRADSHSRGFVWQKKYLILRIMSLWITRLPAAKW